MAVSYTHLDVYKRQTLYSYDENHIYGMEALAVYCRDSFGITTDEMQACYRKAGRIMTDRIGTDTAAIHSRMLRMQCMLELLEQPLFPHARNMYHAYWDTFIQHIDVYKRQAYSIAILAFYGMAGVIRLAYFNVMEAKRQSETSENRKYYQGLPITSMAVIMPFLFVA